MSGQLGHAGYRSRPIHPEDPLICMLCGITIGEQRLKDDEKRLAEVEAAHKPACKRRRDHQTTHRTLDGPCGDGCPEEEL